MGKKRSQNCEEKPLSHKIPGVANSGQQKQERRRLGSLRQKLKVQLTKDGSVNKSKEFSRQMLLARLLVQIQINFSVISTDSFWFCKETYLKMLDSARENVPETVLGLLGDKLLDMFGRSYRDFVGHLLKNIWLKVHLRCLQEDAGLSDEGMAEMHPLDLLKLLDGVNNTHTPSEERKMKALVNVFGLHTPDIVTELVEKMVEAFKKLVPDEFAKIAHEHAMAHAMALAVQGISLASQ